MQKPPIYKILEALEKHNKGYKQMGNGQYMASCPTRDDKNWSLSIAVRADGTVLLNDFAGKATAQDVVTALGLALRDLYPDNRLTPKQLNIHQPDAIYSYRDAQGVEISQVCRFEFTNKDGLPDKTFRQRHHDGNKWVWKAPKNTPLYRLPDLRAADPHLWVFIPEGEKDVDRLYGAALVATTNMGGAARAWPDDYCHELQGRKVALLADNDRSGKKRVETLAAQLSRFAARVVILTPDDLGINHIPGGDVTDALELDLIVGADLVQKANNAKYDPPPGIKKYAPGKKWTLDELMAADFPDLQWIIPDILPAGMALLAAKQKTGKGWILLNWLVEIATGGQIWGADVEQRKCLFISLEDGKEQIQDRYGKLGYHTANQLILQFERPELFSPTGLHELENEIISEGYGLVVIDTFSRAALSIDQSAMNDMMPVLDVIQNIAKENHMCILISDHNRKSMGGGGRDSLYDVFGSIAKTLTADTIISMNRTKDDFGSMEIVGRRLKTEYEFALKFNRATGFWEKLGNLQAVQMQNKYDEVINALKDLGGSGSKDDVADHLGKDASNVNKVLVAAVKDGALLRQKDPNNGRQYIYKVL